MQKCKKCIFHFKDGFIPGYTLHQQLNIVHTYGNIYAVGIDDSVFAFLFLFSYHIELYRNCMEQEDEIKCLNTPFLPGYKRSMHIPLLFVYTN